MKNQPKIIYGLGPTTLTLLFSQGPWVPRMKSVGGHGTSGSGVPETYVQRREETLNVLLRFFDSEWNAVASWLAYCHDTGSSFSFYPDADSGTFYTVYLESPNVEDDVAPRRTQYQSVMELDVTLRSATGTRFTTAYW